MINGGVGGRDQERLARFSSRAGTASSSLRKISMGNRRWMLSLYVAYGGSTDQNKHAVLLKKKRKNTATGNA
jgi:hypothetical protein